MRLFAAVRPHHDVLDHLESALASVGRHGPGPATPEPTAPGTVRWNAREVWHVTLAFYGEVPAGAVDEVVAGLERLAAESAPPRVTLRGAGVFSGRTLWIGTGGDTAGLVALCRGARDVGEEVLGRAEERERVRPHLTVGRQVVDPRARRGRQRTRTRGQADDVARALAVYEGPAWDAETILLVRSEPGRGAAGGPLYEDLATIPVGRY